MNERLAFPPSSASSPFSTPLAVDTWDAQFRLREDGRLRDLTIDSTWQRVAHALAGGSLPLEREMLDAFTGWFLLPDPRLIATAGTPDQSVPDDLTMSINVAAFVDRPLASGALFNCARLAQIASLAVRAFEKLKPLPTRLRIGVIGFADAVELLDIEYGSSPACALAREIAQTIWCSAVEASTNLVREGAPSFKQSEEWLTRACALGLPDSTLEHVRAFGMRHSRLTAITSQAALARLANCVSDALDPIGIRCDTHRRRVESHRREDVACHRSVKTPEVIDSVAAQLRIRSGMQPWMDEPIGYRLVTRETYDDKMLEQWGELARHHGLGGLVIEKAG